MDIPINELPLSKHFTLSSSSPICFDVNDNFFDNFHLKEYFSCISPKSWLLKHSINLGNPLTYNDKNIIKNNDDCDIFITEYSSKKNSNSFNFNYNADINSLNFNHWDYSESELACIIRHIVIHFISKIDYEFVNAKSFLESIDNFLIDVWFLYNNVPFHNFKHAFNVTHMMFIILQAIQIQGTYATLNYLDAYTLILTALCHDLDHPGFSNSYQKNAQTNLFHYYGPNSTLESHHASLAISLIFHSRHSILLTMLNEGQKKICFNILRSCILATDMARHTVISGALKDRLNTNEERPNKCDSSGSDVGDNDTKELLCMMLLKICDISNEIRPKNVSAKWLDILLEEFFIQGDYEKLNDMPLSSFMDRDTVSKWDCQIGFIQYVIMPLLEIGYQFVPCLRELFADPIEQQLIFYQGMADSEEIAPDFSTLGKVSRKSSDGSHFSQSSQRSTLKDI